MLKTLIPCRLSKACTKNIQLKYETIQKGKKRTQGEKKELKKDNGL